MGHTRWAMQQNAPRRRDAQMLEQLRVEEHGLHQLADVLHTLADASHAAISDIWCENLKYTG